MVKFATADREKAGSISGTLLRPSTPGVAPAVVLLHGGSGVEPNQHEWARLLTDDGYVTLVVVSTRLLSGNPTAETKAGDAVGALAYLRTLPFVDGTRIGVMGFSHGAAAALAVVSGLVDARSAGGGFRSGVMLYPPGCSYRAQRSDAPLLVLLGELDGSPVPCQDMQRRLAAAGGPPVTLTIYPGAHHAFDDARATAPSGWRGLTVMYDGVATAKARTDVRAFFDEYLRRAK
jgi:dienelactone hydrolase